MISICTTVYFEKENLEIFIRSLCGNASDNDYEIVIVNGANSTTETLDRLKKNFPIKVINYSREDRIKFIKKMIDYYEKNKIFSKEDLDGMWITYERYKSGKIDKLWLPTPQKFNMAAKVAQGDVLVFLPSDYLVFFDVSKLYKKVKSMLNYKGMFYGHFDWINLDDIEPISILNGLKQCKGTFDFQEYTQRLIFMGTNQVRAQHGARVVDKKLYTKIGGFDERWFTRAIGEDLFNEKARQEWGSLYRLLDYPEFETEPMFVGALRPLEPKNYDYLNPRYTINADDHHYFLNKIKAWMN